MSKLSIHISNWLDPDKTYDFIERAQPAIVKCFGDAGLDDAKIREAKNRSPGTLFVGRKYFREQGVEKDETSPVDTVMKYDANADARSAFDQMSEIVGKCNGLIDVWEGYNEVPIDTNDPISERNRQKARNLNAFNVALAKLMHDNGQKYAAYSFSTSNPVHVEMWDLILDGLRASDYLALHEYIRPDEAWQNFDNGSCNRYRQIYARVPASAQRPILLTECGCDFNGEQGYRTKLSPEAYLAKMAAYDAELMKDPYVIGATIFCYGIDDPKWKTYDIGGDFTKMLRAYVMATPTPVVVIPPAPVPPPVPPPAPPVTPPLPTPTPGPENIYVVQSGDTLSAIGKKFGVSVAALVAANQITNPSLIRVGQRLVIPLASTPAPIHTFGLAEKAPVTTPRAKPKKRGVSPKRPTTQRSPASSKKGRAKKR